MATPAPAEPETEGTIIVCDDCGRADIPVLSLVVGRRKPLELCVLCLAKPYDEQLGWNVVKIVENMTISLLAAKATGELRAAIRSAVRGE